jgi:hypothetical protein
MNVILLLGFGVLTILILYLLLEVASRQILPLGLTRTLINEWKLSRQKNVKMKK